MNENLVFNCFQKIFKLFIKLSFVNLIVFQIKKYVLNL